jgi:glycolate oxidase
MMATTSAAPDTHAQRQCLDALRRQLPPDAIVTDPDVAEGYRFDRARTIRPGTPLAVLRPRNADDVSIALREANRFGIPVVTRGAGTGLSGGAAALDGALTLSTERLRALHIDEPSMTATVGPGVFNAEVKAAAKAHGLWYPPDPSSFEICSIGGNLATNAGGLCCVKYGVTTDYVLGIEVVLADGRIVRLGGRTIKDVAGYDLKRLFIGSEGTLGVLTEATLRLRPTPPPASTVVATFPDVVTAGRAVLAVMARLRPLALELMDAAAVAAVESVRPMGLEGVGALLLAQSDGEPSEALRIETAFVEAGATYVALTQDPEEGELLMGARRMAVPCVERLGAVLIEDVGVPIPRIPELLAEIETIARLHRTSIPTIGHAGDGNFHPLITFDPTDPDATARAELAFHAIMTSAIALGGTVTGEHGIGTLKAAHLEEQIGEGAMDLARTIKSALDPRGILNPTKWI